MESKRTPPDPAAALSDPGGVRRRLADRVRAVATLRASDPAYRGILEGLHDAYFLADNEGVLVMVSPSCGPLLGCLPAEAIGKDLARDFYAPPARRGELLDLLRPQGRVQGFEARLRRADGGIVPVCVNAALCRDGDGTAIGVEEIARDVSDRVDRDAQADRLQRLEAIETLAGGIAHDFTNCLTSIMGYASLLQNGSIGTRELVRAADVILRAAQKGATIAGQLGSLSRRGGSPPVVADIRALLEDLRRRPPLPGMIPADGPPDR